MRLLLAIFIGKIISFLTKKLNIGGGSAAPGLYALKIDSRLVEKLSAKIPQNVVITGTNGKTTTAKILAHFAKTSGLKIIRNHTGSNLERGMASTLIQGSKLTNTGCWLDSNIGIWELDEAAFNTVVSKIKPQVVVFLNVFRDQLDRYGEIDTVVKNWCATLQKLPANTKIMVNGDDANTTKLAKCFKGSVQKFGVKDYKIIGESIERISERENLDFEAKNVKLNGLKNSNFQLQTTNYLLPTTLPIPGIYHIYDFLAAFAAGAALNLNPKNMISSLKSYSPAFGRVEKFDLNPRSHRTPTSEVGYIFLIKNPAGATQVFETIAPHIKPADRMLLALNDNLADGTDISWIWDAQFEKLSNQASLRAPAKQSQSRLPIPLRGALFAPRNDIIVSGTRANDLAVRLKYAGFDSHILIAEPDLKKAFKEARNGLKGQLFILPTYTAMLELQSILTKTGVKNHYWESD